MNEPHQLHSPTPRKTALVLGGGGGLGVVQAAYIQAAYELGFRADFVVGTSVGALNGAWIALHPDDPEGLLRIWRTLAQQKVLHLNPVRVAARVARRRRGFCPNSIVPYLIDRHVGTLAFDDTIVPLNVVATNLTSGRKHVFSSGSLAPAITASTAIPGVFDPFELDGELFVDGCVTASLDLQTAIEFGATEILAIDLAPAVAPASPRTAVGVLRRSFGILSHSATDAMVAAAERVATVQVLRPDLASFSPWRISVGDAAIEASLAAARTNVRLALAADGSVRPPLSVDPAPVIQAPPVALRPPRPSRWRLLPRGAPSVSRPA